MENIKQALINSLLSGQKTVEVEGIVFECLPTLKRDTQRRRELQAEIEAEKLCKILSE